MNKLVLTFAFCVSTAVICSLGRPGLSAPARPPAPEAPVSSHAAPPALVTALGIEFVKNSTTTVIVERAGKKYVVDLIAQTVSEAGLAPLPATPVSPKVDASSAFASPQVDGSVVFKAHCTMCHGPDGRGLVDFKTPNFTDPKIQASLTDTQILATIQNGKKGTPMPAWRNELSAGEIKAVAEQVRSFGAGGNAQPATAPQTSEAENHKVYKPGDDVLFTLPTGRRLDRHGLYTNFSHRFVFDPAFSGTARGGALLGLDGSNIPSFGFRYGVTDKLSVSIFRAPSLIGRPIQLMAAYNFMDERDGAPLNMAVRVSMEGLNDFLKDYTENIEGIFSRSISSRAQIYIVPTVSLNNRQLQEVFSFRSRDILDLPGHNSFSLGAGLAVDIRPTVALVAEVIPTLVNGRALAIHRPAYSFGIQKKIWRHAFTLGFTTSPGTTVSQRAGTRASYMGDPTADKPSGLFIGFDLTRQIF